MLFYFSKDRRFVIKTITRPELKFFRKIVKEYYAHMMKYAHSLLPRSAATLLTTFAHFAQVLGHV